MRTLVLVFAAVVLSAVAPAYGQQPQHRIPERGALLLEHCGLVADDVGASREEEDTSWSPFEVFKRGWCLGHLQTMRDMITFGHFQTEQEGGPGPKSSETCETCLRDTFVSICIPDEASLAQLARVVVKWVRDHPEALHLHHFFLTIEAFKDAFPCQAHDTTK